ncbi:MAG: shikimate kinase, partial [Oscillospiraceae bacterium]|nr:shikimate kinase [Oscillospiraceae bacterium]
SAESGLIIATGGGVVTVPENRPLIRQNSVCVFLERELNELPIAQRPLSQSVGVQELWRQREPLYRQWCDLSIKNEVPPRTAREIKEALGL